MRYSNQIKVGGCSVLSASQSSTDESQKRSLDVNKTRSNYTPLNETLSSLHHSNNPPAEPPPHSQTHVLMIRITFGIRVMMQEMSYESQRRTLRQKLQKNPIIEIITSFNLIRVLMTCFLAERKQDVVVAV